MNTLIPPDMTPRRCACGGVVCRVYPADLTATEPVGTVCNRCDYVVGHGGPPIVAARLWPRPYKD